MADERPGSRGAPQPGAFGDQRSPGGMPRSRAIPGEIGWKPGPGDIDRSGGPDQPGKGTGTPGRPGREGGPGRQGGPGRTSPGPGLTLCLASIFPFLVGGVVGVVALVGWTFLFIFGVGEQETIWAWASGRPAGEVVTQVALVVLFGLGCVAVTVGAMWAGLHGFTRESGVLFWTASQLVFGLLAIAMVVVDHWAWDVTAAAGIGSVEWWLLFAVVALGLVTARLRASAARPVNGCRDGYDAAG